MPNARELLGQTGYWSKPTSTSLGLLDITDLSEEEARLKLAEIRWGSKDEQECPKCGVRKSHYVIQTRRQWRCKDCKSTFSVTTGSPFADRKLSHKKMLLAIFLFVTDHKGLSALKLKRQINGDYRTSFVLLHKIRDALTRSVRPEKLGGIVEIDGAHFSGRPRKGRKRRRKVPPQSVGAEHRARLPDSSYWQHPNRRIVMVMREYAGWKAGASKTVVEICRSENSQDVKRLAKKWIEPGSTIRTDENKAYTVLKRIEGLNFHHEVVNHSVEFSTDAGVNENQAESYFSRLRRSQKGIHHRITPHYMIDYASEMAWREEARREPTVKQMKKLVARVFNAGLSKDWRGYSQGRRRRVEKMAA